MAHTHANSTRALERVRAHLGDALEDSGDPEVRYHLRQALQLADAVDAGQDDRSPVREGSPSESAPGES